MKIKVLKTIASILVLLSLLASSIVLPVSAAQSDETGIGLKKGDKVVLATDVVATVDSVNKDGTVTYTAVMGELKYCEDLVTPINTTWQYDSKTDTYYIKDNIYSVEVNGDKVKVTYKKESYNWQPVIYIGKNKIKLPSNGSIMNPDTGSFTDPINENYSGNTLYWQYGDITRCLRAIEGMLIEYYIIDNMPDGDIRIVTNANKSDGYIYSRPEYAYDAESNSIALTSDSKSSGELLITLDSLKDAVFPITIDPDSSFNSTSADGYIGQGGFGDYTTMREYASGSVVNTDTILSIGQLFDGDYYIKRSFVFFDTSSLGDVSITDSKLKLYIQYKSAVDVTDFDIVIQKGVTSTYPHNPLQNGDYLYSNYESNGGSLNTSLISANLSEARYYEIDLNATGISWISKNGMTKLALISSMDINAQAPSGYDYLQFYAYEKGAGYRPILTVTYTSTPTVTNSTGASLISDTTARLNGSLISDGGLDTTVKVYYGDNDGATTAGNWDSNYDFGVKTAGALYYDISSLTADTTYYYRFFSTNSADDSWASSTSSFSTYPEPAITLVAASNIAKTSARLNSIITEDGNLPCQVRWGYGTTTQAAIEDYDTYTELAGSYSAGNNPYLDITSLVGNTTYYYMVEITNGITTNLSSELSFETLNTVSEPTNVFAITSSTSITLTWVKGNGSTKTLVRYSVSDNPTTTGAGTLVYFGELLTYELTGLTAGTTYFFSLWGESGETYSTDYVELIATTIEGAAEGDSLNAPTQPFNWLTGTDYTKLVNIPFYDSMNGMAESINMPYNTFWLVFALIMTVIFGAAAYLGINRSALVAFMAILLGLGIWWVVGIVPLYILILFGILFTALVLGRQGYTQN